jgi:hypothetical protein
MSLFLACALRLRMPPSLQKPYNRNVCDMLGRCMRWYCWSSLTCSHGCEWKERMSDECL